MRSIPSHIRGARLSANLQELLSSVEALSGLVSMSVVAVRPCPSLTQKLHSRCISCAGVQQDSAIEYLLALQALPAVGQQYLSTVQRIAL